MNIVVAKIPFYVEREIAIVRKGAEKLCNLMYGTEKRTRITLTLSFAALAFAVYLEKIMASAGFCSVAN